MSALHLVPGSDHPIDVTPSPRPLRVVWNGHVIAETSHAIDLKEASYPVVRYIPRADADMSYFEKTERSSHCPYKGDASYFSLSDGSSRADNAVWSYETPYEAMSEIEGYLAFYPDKVTIEDA